MTKSALQEIDERTNLTSSNKLELLLFRLGGASAEANAELYGINVFKVREIMAMPEITAIAGSHANLLGVVKVRDQIIPVIDLPAMAGCIPKTGLKLILITEYARTTQAFAVESVEEIVRLNWTQVLSAEASGVGGLCTSIARLDDDVGGSRLAQVLDVEEILKLVMPASQKAIDPNIIGPQISLRPGTVILAADDSMVARLLIEGGLDALGAPFVMTKTGKEAWDKLNSIASAAEAVGGTIYDKVALVLTDLEMPEMDGFTLTRSIKQDPRFKNLPVVIHSSLTGATNEDHVKSVGADAYVAKFDAVELAHTIRTVLKLKSRSL